jgi:hypothetical protein
MYVLFCSCPGDGVETGHPSDIQDGRRVFEPPFPGFKRL